jgi:GntR family transcriptional regulator, carbon starvation induced regulator
MVIGKPDAGTLAGPTLSSTLTERVRESIMRGDFMPGMKLHLNNMRSNFGVSLSPLREALCRLESEGLVEIEDQRGYRVAAVSPDNLKEVIRLRVELEGMALREAIRHGDLAWESQILAALHRLNATKRHSRSPEEQEQWERVHREFHAELISACRMPMLQQFCSMLHDQGDRYRRIFLKAHKPDRDVPAEHTAIASAVIARQADSAVKLMRDHIERTGTNVLKVLQRA